MPTLVEVEVEVSADNDNHPNDSVTILGDETTTFGEEEEQVAAKDDKCSRSQTEDNGIGTKDRILSEPKVHENDKDEVYFDDSATILSVTFARESFEKDGDSRYIIPKHHLESHSTRPSSNQEDNYLALRCKHSRTSDGNQCNSILGSNEELYRSKFQLFVENTVREFKRNFPGKLHDYKLLSKEEKLREQQNVLALLARLGLSKGTSTHDSFGLEDRPFDRPPSSMCRTGQVGALTPFDSPGFNFMSAKEETEEYSCNRRDSKEDSKRFPLPVGLKMTVDTEEKQRFPASSEDKSSESVEIVRAATSFSSASNPFDSPMRLSTNLQKRLASTSGKRGADAFRWKYNEDFIPSIHENNLDLDPEILPSEIREQSRDSSDREHFFCASQSPIEPRLTFESSDDEEILTGSCQHKRELDD